MASTARTFPQESEYGKYRIWILGFIQRQYGVDLSAVRLALAPNFTLGGGGLYMKSNEGKGNLSLATMATGIDGEELKGNYLVVKAEQLWSTKPAKLKTCWIIWHEFGHALGEDLPGRAGYGLDEAHAWKFELEAVLDAVRDGTLESWGHSKSSILEFLEGRVAEAYKPIGDAQIRTFNEDVKPLIVDLRRELAS
jgi:hypothetical protein